MILEKGRISSSQLILPLLGYCLSYSVIFMPGQEAGHDVWISTIAGIGEGLFLAFIYVSLALKFPGKNLLEINDYIYGRYLGKLISISYLWYFLHIASLVLRNYGDFFSGVFLVETPYLVFIIPVMIACASAVRNGIEVITRTAIVLMPITLFMYVFNFFFLLNEMDFKAFEPFFEITFKQFTDSSHHVAVASFGEAVVFLLIFPFINKVKQIRMPTFLGFILAGGVLVLNAVQNVAVLGAASKVSTYATVQAVRIINVGDIFTRIEFTVYVILVATVFLKISILYYGVCLGTAQLLKLRTYLPLVLPYGIIIILLGTFQFENVMQIISWFNETYPYYSLPFQIFLPALSLIIAYIKNPSQEGRAK